MATIQEITNKFDIYEWNIINTSEIDKQDFKSVVLEFADNVDDFATAFTALISFVIRCDLGDKSKTYQEVLSEYTEELVNKTKFSSQDKKNLITFLNNFSDTICQNDYGNNYEQNMYKLYKEYNYSIISIYLFCYYMHLYCMKEKEEILNKLNEIFTNMKSDMLDYVLCLGGSYAQVFLFPMCYYGAVQEMNLSIILEYWKSICEKLSISQDSSIQLSNFFKKYVDYNSKNKDTYMEDIFAGFSYHLTFSCSIENELNYINNEPITRSDSEVERTSKLHIFNFVKSKNIFKKLLQTNLYLKETNTALTESQENKRHILNSFSHRYKNMKTTSLYKVANALLKMDSKELKKYGRTVLLEYGIKENLKKEVDILQLQFEDNIDKLKEKIQNSTQQQYSQQDNFSISEIINNVIKKCIITLVHDGGDESKAIRKFCFKDYDLISIRNSFEENVLFEENINPVTWFKENIAHNFEVSISPFWKEIFFKKHDYADNIISDLLTDLLMNALKYADKTQNIQFDLDEDDNFMIIKSRNTTVKDKTNIPSSGIGLESQNDLLNVLNKAETNLNNSITFEESDGIFSIEVRISKNLVRGNEDV